MIKRLINGVLKKFDIALVPYDHYTKAFDKIKHNWLKSININTIIDIGAGDGEYSKRSRHIWPKSTIHSFEALPQVADELKDKFQHDKKH